MSSLPGANPSACPALPRRGMDQASPVGEFDCVCTKPLCPFRQGEVFVGEDVARWVEHVGKLSTKLAEAL